MGPVLNALKRTMDRDSMTKKMIIWAAVAVCMLVAAFGLMSLREREQTEEATSVKKMHIVVTLFPQYDFVKQITEDRVVVEFLLPPGVESHTYEPSPSDIEKISNADMFIYTGKYMEQWAEKIIAGINNDKLNVVDVSENVELIKSGEDEHEHASEENLSEDHDHDKEHHEHEGHDHLFDPHIWTDPNNAMIMAENILSALCIADPENADFYKNNAAAFNKKLVKLDEDFKSAVASGKRREVIFGGRNAFHYFMRRYGLKCIAAHDSCSAQADASVKKIREIMDIIRKDNIPVIYFEELVAPKIAIVISSETGVKMLPFNSCHNITKEDVDAGATYISLMRGNLANLKEGLR